MKSYIVSFLTIKTFEQKKKLLINSKLLTCFQNLKKNPLLLANKCQKDKYRHNYEYN